MAVLAADLNQRGSVPDRPVSRRSARVRREGGSPPLGFGQPSTRARECFLAERPSGGIKDLGEHAAEVVAFDTVTACLVEPGAQRLGLTSSDVCASSLGNDRIEADGHLRRGHTFVLPSNNSTDIGGLGRTTARAASLTRLWPKAGWSGAAEGSGALALERLEGALTGLSGGLVARRTLCSGGLLGHVDRGGARGSDGLPPLGLVTVCRHPDWCRPEIPAEPACSVRHRRMSVAPGSTQA